jgi:hypothetical protein
LPVARVVTETVRANPSDRDGELVAMLLARASSSRLLSGALDALRGGADPRGVLELLEKVATLRGSEPVGEPVGEPDGVVGGVAWANWRSSDSTVAAWARFVVTATNPSSHTTKSRRRTPAVMASSPTTPTTPRTTLTRGLSRR